MEYNKVDPTNDLYLRSEGRAGGPNDPTSCFSDAYNAINALYNDSKYPTYKDHPLFEQLKKYSFDLTPGVDPDEDSQNEQQTQFREISKDIVTMSEEWRVMMNCDEI